VRVVLEVRSRVAANALQFLDVHAVRVSIHAAAQHARVRQVLLRLSVARLFRYSDKAAAVVRVRSTVHVRVDCKSRSTRIKIHALVRQSFEDKSNRILARPQTGYVHGGFAPVVAAVDNVVERTRKHLLH